MVLASYQSLTRLLLSIFTGRAEVRRCCEQLASACTIGAEHFRLLSVREVKEH